MHARKLHFYSWSAFIQSAHKYMLLDVIVPLSRL